MKKALILYNPLAGDRQGERIAQVLGRVLEERGLAVEDYQSKSGPDLAKGAGLACQRGMDYLFVLGGDGSVQDALNGLKAYEKKPVLGIIPMGTGNLLATTLGIKGKPDQIIGELDLERKKFIDVGQAGDRVFGYIFSLGQVSKKIHETDKEDKKTFGVLAYGREILGSGPDFPAYDLRLDIDGQVIEGSFTHLLISNTTRLGDHQYADGANKPDDGLFNVFAFKKMSGGQMVNLAIQALRGEMEESDRVALYTGRRVKVSSDQEEVPTDLDGDKGPSLPLKLEVLEDFVEVLYI